MNTMISPQQKETPKFIRCRIFLCADPGADRDIVDWWTRIKPDFENKCGVTFIGVPELFALLGPYDFVFELNCESVDDIGMLAGWLRYELREWIVSSTTIMERGYKEAWVTIAREGTKARVLVLLSAKPTQMEKVEEFKSKLYELAGEESLDIIPVFGEYDYIVEFSSDTLHSATHIVDSMRHRIGSYLSQTVTLIERKP